MAVTTQASGTLTTATSSRTVTDGVTNATTTITSATASFVSGDVGRIVTGSSDLTSLVSIASVTNSTTAVLTTACTGSHTAQTFNLTAEYALAAINAAATYVFGLDLNAIASGDIATARVYKMGLTGGTSRVYIAQQINFDSVNSDNLIWQSIPVSTALTDTNALLFTFKQTAGSSRSVPYWAEKYA